MNASAPTVPGVILAGGQSRRFGGGDKALADLAGTPMVGHVIARLRPQVAALALNANGDPARFAKFGLAVLPDPVGRFAGPLAGVLAALQWAREAGASFVATVPADTPFIAGDLVRRLAAGATGAEIVVARSRGAVHPTIALWRTSQADALAAWLTAGSDRAVRAWIGARASATVDFADDGGADPFFNVNTLADLETARRRAIAEAGGTWKTEGK